MQIEVGKRYSIHMAGGDIATAGIRAVTSRLAMDETWKPANPQSTLEWLPPLPSDWLWTWMVTEGSYSGAFPRRVSKFYWLNYQIKLPAALVADIGTLARAHVVADADLSFDVTNKIDWNKGAFGDAGSCYWGSQTGSRLMVEENGLAIRFYHNGTNYGYARAWLAALPSRDSEVDFYVVFNGYGFEGNSTLRITQVLARFLGVEYRPIRIDCDALSVNGGDAGYAVGTADKLPDYMDYVEFGWEAIYGDSCYNCGCYLDDGDAYVGADEEYYCQDCFYDRFDDCHDCGDVHFRDNLHYVASIDADVCASCLRENYSKCKGCLEHFRDDRVDERGYCESCAVLHSESKSPDDDDDDVGGDN